MSDVDTRMVLDTNIVLDLFVFDDPHTHTLKLSLLDGTMQWLATQPMRDELERVLAYPKIVRRMQMGLVCAADVLQRFDALASLQALAPKASVTCRDPDDQKFIDLAVAHRVRIFSKDQAVLCMAKRLLTLGVIAQAAIK